MRGLPEDHKCSNQHGHSYLVRVELKSERLNAVGFVLDFGDLEPFKKYINTHFDHKNLDDVFLGQSSAENLAKHFYDYCEARWPETSRVGVRETKKCWAYYQEGDL